MESQDELINSNVFFIARQAAPTGGEVCTQVGESIFTTEQVAESFAKSIAHNVVISIERKWFDGAPEDLGKNNPFACKNDWIGVPVVDVKEV